jgi:electron transfer flavoprotein alpha subunit
VADIHVLVAGSACNAAAEQAASLQGVTIVKVADAAHYQSQTAENLTALVIAQAGGYSHILAPATTFGKNLCRANRRAARCRPDLRNHRR